MSDTDSPDLPITHRNRQTLSLSLGSSLVQSSMRLDDPSALLLEYTRAMMGFLMLNPAPERLLMIGLGGGSLVKYCHQHLSSSHVTVVEISQEVISLRDEFLLPPDDARLAVVCADGAAYMARSDQRFDVILVDGFSAEGQPPALCSALFYRHCAARLDEQGVLVINMHAAEPQLGAQLKRLQKVFGQQVLEIAVDDGDNRVVLVTQDSCWRDCLAQFESRWQALLPVHQGTLGASSSRFERALRKRRPSHDGS